MSSIPGNFIFRYSIPVKKLESLPTSLSPESLDSTFSLPLCTRYCGEPKRDKVRAVPERRRSLRATYPDTSEKKQNELVASFEFRLGWHEDGMVATAILKGKNRPLRCDMNNLEYSDGLHICLDTRDVRDVHRGTRFCHRFFFMPHVSESRADDPVGFWLPIHRAKSLPNPVDMSHFLLSSKVTDSGWSLSILLPESDLTGYDPGEHSRIGFYFAASDFELGLFSLQHPSLFPAEEDPSLWSTLELNS